jgi:hypothetical protein
MIVLWPVKIIAYEQRHVNRRSEEAVDEERMSEW